MKPIVAILLAAGCFVFLSCGRFSCKRNYLGTRRSLTMEQENINAFFVRNGFELEVSHTSNVPESRIFLHEFEAEAADIVRMVEILQLDSVTQGQFDTLHTSEYSYTPYQVHSPTGKDYLKNPDVRFYKCEEGNARAQEEIKATKVYLYYNCSTKQACFQTFYGWG